MKPIFGKIASHAACANIFTIMTDSNISNIKDKITEFGMRVQRCYGCFVAYRMKDMYLGEDVTFYCEHCKDDSMFHFDQFSAYLDPEKINATDSGHHH